MVFGALKSLVGGKEEPKKKEEKKKEAGGGPGGLLGKVAGTVGAVAGGVASGVKNVVTGGKSEEASRDVAKTEPKEEDKGILGSIVGAVGGVAGSAISAVRATRQKFTSQFDSSDSEDEADAKVKPIGVSTRASFVGDAPAAPDPKYFVALDATTKMVCHANHPLSVRTMKGRWACRACGHIGKSGASVFRCLDCDFNICGPCEKAGKVAPKPQGEEAPAQKKDDEVPRVAAEATVMRCSKQHRLAYAEPSTDWTCTYCAYKCPAKGPEVASFVCTTCGVFVCGRCETGAKCSEGHSLRRTKGAFVCDGAKCDQGSSTGNQWYFGCAECKYALCETCGKVASVEPGSMRTAASKGGVPESRDGKKKSTLSEEKRQLLGRLRVRRAKARAKDLGDVASVVAQAQSLEAILKGGSGGTLHAPAEAHVVRIIGAADVAAKASAPPSFVSQQLQACVKDVDELRKLTIGGSEVTELITSVAEKLAQAVTASSGGSSQVPEDAAKALFDAATKLEGALRVNLFGAATLLESSVVKDTSTTLATMQYALAKGAAKGGSGEDLDKVRAKIAAIRARTEKRATQWRTYTTHNKDFGKYRTAFVDALRRYVTAVKASAKELCKNDLGFDWTGEDQQERRTTVRPGMEDALKKAQAAQKNDTPATGDDAPPPPPPTATLDDGGEVEPAEGVVDPSMVKFDTETLESPGNHDTTHVLKERQAGGNAAPADDPYRSLKWLAGLHKASVASSAAKGSFQYSAEQVKMMMWKGIDVLFRVIDFLEHADAQVEGNLEFFYAEVDVKLANIALTSVKRFAELNLDPDHGVDLLFVAFIYTVDMTHCSCKSLSECLRTLADEKAKKKAGQKYTKHCRPSEEDQPKNSKAHGYKHQPWAVANWALRVGYDDNTDEATKKMCIDTLEELFVPFIERLDEAIFLLPTDPAVVFRGVPLPLATKYALDTSVIFSPFTSTSLEGVAAEKFMKKGADGTFFILRLHSAAMIDFVSWFPDQAEALCPTHTGFFVKGKTSRTMMQMLGCRYDIVTMSEIGGSHNDDQKAIWMYESSRRTMFLYANYLDKYVESRVSPNPPPQRHTTLIFDEVDSWLVNDAEPVMLLVGSGGSGKTSAALGCLSKLMASTNRTEMRPVLPFFIALPSVVGLLSEDGALDAHVCSTLGFDIKGLEHMASKYTVVLLLDSLDEVPIGHIDGDSAIPRFLDNNPWCRNHVKCIVSVRQEFFDRPATQPAESLLSVNSTDTNVLYVQPFSDEDVIAFIYKTQRALTAPIGSDARNDETKMKALGEASLESYRRLVTLGVDTSALHHPCTLYIALVALLDGEALLDRNRRTSISAIYEAFLQSQLRHCLSELKTPGATMTQVMEGLENVALSMLNAGQFMVTVGDFKKHFSFFEGNDAERVLLSTPRRCEDDHFEFATMGFWHKTLAEYLAARALLRRPDVLTQVKTNSFTRSTPMVQKFAEDIVVSSSAISAHFKQTVAPKWLALLKAEGNSKEGSLAGNAFAMLAACRHVFDRTGGDANSLANLTFNRANLCGARLINCAAAKTSFHDCDVTATAWDNSDVSGAHFDKTVSDIQQAPIPVDMFQQFKTLRTSHDRRFVLVYDHTAVRIYNVDKSKLVSRFHGVFLDINASFTRIIMRGIDQKDTVSVLDVSSGEVLKTIEVKEFKGQTEGLTNQFTLFYRTLTKELSTSVFSAGISMNGGAAFLGESDDFALAITLSGKERDKAYPLEFSGVCVYDANFKWKAYNTLEGRYPKWVVRDEEQRITYIRSPYVKLEAAQAMMLDIPTNKTCPAPSYLAGINWSNSVSPDGRLLADFSGSESPSVVVVRSLRPEDDGGVVARLDHGSLKPKDAQFSVTSVELVTAADRICLVWDVSSAIVVAQRSVDGAIEGVSMHSAKRFFAFAHGNNTTLAKSNSLSLQGEEEEQKSNSLEKQTDHRIHVWGISFADQVTQFNTSRPQVLTAEGDTVFSLPEFADSTRFTRPQIHQSQLHVIHKKGIVTSAIPSGATVHQKQRTAAVGISPCGQWAVLARPPELKEYKNGHGSMTPRYPYHAENFFSEIYNTRSGSSVRSYNLKETYQRRNHNTMSISNMLFIDSHFWDLPGGKSEPIFEMYSYPVCWAAHFPQGTDTVVMVILLFTIQPWHSKIARLPEPGTCYTLFDEYSLSTGKRMRYHAHPFNHANWVINDDSGGFFPLESPVHFEPGYPEHDSAKEWKTHSMVSGKLMQTPNAMKKLQLGKFKTSVDGKRIVTWTGGRATVSDSASSAELVTIDHATHSVSAVVDACFASQDANLVVTASTAAVLLTDVKTKALIAKRNFGGEQPPNFIAISCQSQQHIAAIANENRAYILRGSGAQGAGWTFGPPRREGHSKPVVTLAYAASTNQVVTAGEDRYAILWDLSCGGREVARVDLSDTIVGLDIAENIGDDGSWAALLVGRQTVACTNFKNLHICKTVGGGTPVGGACVRGEGNKNVFLAVATVTKDSSSVSMLAIPSLNPTGESSLSDGDMAQDVAAPAAGSSAACVLVIDSKGASRALFFGANAKGIPKLLPVSHTLKKPPKDTKIRFLKRFPIQPLRVETTLPGTKYSDEFTVEANAGNVVVNGGKQRSIGRPLSITVRRDANFTEVHQGSTVIATLGVPMSLSIGSASGKVTGSAALEYAFSADQAPARPPPKATCKKGHKMEFITRCPYTRVGTFAGDALQKHLRTMTQDKLDEMNFIKCRGCDKSMKGYGFFGFSHCATCSQFDFCPSCTYDSVLGKKK